MMFDILAQNPNLAVILAATLLPLAAFVVVLLFTRSRPKLSAGLSIGAMGGSLLCALFLLIRHPSMDVPLQYAGRWLISGKINIPVGFLLDPVSILMLFIVAAISFLVQVYSLGYMAGDPGFSRYFAFLSLFGWAMESLAVSPNLLQLYIFWEIVGLSSYLLIGFWYQKFSASQAGKKAFVMTRLGDIGFFLGILLLLFHTGRLDIATLAAASTGMSPSMTTLAILLIFGGIIGKSAQFPLMTWLPDAMEGPTPVSALLHSATMVAAGVFLFVRIFPFFSTSQSAMTVCLAVGTVSMLLSATMAMVSRDIKQVWAFSSISQLGFMIMGLGAGSRFAGMFHLTTHAGFKALLFLCSGVFIHHFGTNDIETLGRSGCRRQVIPMVCLVIAAAALSGVPPFSGFFSKESILSALAGLENPFWLVAGFLGAFLTAYYAFRLVFLLLFPPGGMDSNHEPAHRNWAMAAPLLILAFVSVVLGFFGKDLMQFLGSSGAGGALHKEAHRAWLTVIALAMPASGIVLAWFEFGRKSSDRKGFVERIPSLADFFSQRWYLDKFYAALVRRVVDGGLSALCAGNDRKVIDESIDTFSRSVIGAGRRVSMWHVGRLQQKLFVMFAVVMALVIYFGFNFG